MNCLQLIKYSGPALDTIIKNTQTIKLDKVLKKPLEKKFFFLKNSIKINNLSFSFSEKDKPTLANISYEIKVGKKIGIIGDSGTGKTTLINVLIGLLSPSKGEVLVDKQNIFKNISQWQSIIGYVPQNIFLLDDTLIRNIALGQEDNQIDNNKIKSLINITKLKNLVEKSTKGLDVNVGELGEKISGGERQRLGIARALYKDPQILILDESTSALDLNTENEIISDLHNIMKDKTMIIISHRKSTLNKCDEVLSLNQKGLLKI